MPAEDNTRHSNEDIAKSFIVLSTKVLSMSPMKNPANAYVTRINTPEQILAPMLLAGNGEVISSNHAANKTATGTHLYKSLVLMGEGNEIIN